MKFAYLFAAAALAACSPVAGNADAPVTASERPIEGTYVVTFANETKPLINIDGYQPTVTIDGNRIHFQSQCIYHDWSYDRSGESIVTERWTYPETDGIVAMCARGLAPGETAIIDALGGAGEVRAVRGGLRFTGRGGTVEMRRISSERESADRDVSGGERSAPFAPRKGA